MVSDLLNRHPQILSLSEFFVTLGADAFSLRRPDGDRMWRLLTTQSAGLHAMLKDGHVVEETLYPYDDPASRYGAADMPPIIAVTLPHLTDTPEALLDALEPRVRARPRMPIAEQYRALFGDLAEMLDRRVWIERSGGTLMHAAKLLRMFPDARVVHVYRDGRDTAMSMSQHHNFRVLVGAILRCRRLGIDPQQGFSADRGSRLNPLIERIVFTVLDIEKTAALPTLEDFGRFWSDLILIGLECFAGLPSERLLNLRFEDVQSDPRRKLDELIRFIDPSLADDAWLDEVAAIPRPARSKFQTLPEEVQTTLTSACAPGLERLGYPL